MDTIRGNVAVVGYGGMGRWHVEELRSMPEANLCGVYDILPERCHAAEQNGVHAYDSLEELMGDKDVEIVTVAIPNDLHMPVSIQAMQAGKHVVCEKPVALDCEQFQQMIDASKKYKVVLTVHQNRRWDEDFLIIKKIFDEGMLGRVFRIESRVQGSRGIPGDWRKTKEHGGGMILDWGVHLLDQILQIVPGKIETVYADVSHLTNKEVDCGFRTILHFEDDVVCQVEVETNNFISLPRWYILGENGSAVIEDWDLKGRIVKIFNRVNGDAIPVKTAAGLTKTMAPRTQDTIKEYPLPAVSSDVKSFYRNLFQTISGETEQIVQHDEVMRVLKLIEAIRSAGENEENAHTRL